MKKNTMRIRRALLFIILTLLIAPYVQTSLNIIEIQPLKGAVLAPEKKEFTLKDWFSGTYQENFEDYLNATFGFRNLFVRLNNQLAFSLFNRARANGVIVGKENYLYEENYIKAYYGTDFIGEDRIRKRFDRLKFVQDTLNALDKTLLLVFAPGKASYYPEYIPDVFHTEKALTNYSVHRDMADQFNLNYIDFNEHFLKLKSTSKFPLYPQYGIHWSDYGMCLAADSILKYIEITHSIDLPNLYWNEVNWAEPHGTDYDIADGMNIFLRLPSFKMAYPILQFESDSVRDKVKALFISDSFYWGMFGSGVFSRAFSRNSFWFYNKQAYLAGKDQPQEVSQLNLKDEISSHDVFIIMATESTLPDFGWGFIENAYELFHGQEQGKSGDPTFQERVTNQKNYIKSDKKWMESIKEKAKLKNISIDSMVTLDAIWHLEHQ